MTRTNPSKLYHRSASGGLRQVSNDEFEAMRTILSVTLLCFSVVAHGQSSLDQNIEKVKTIIEQHDPCNTTVFCFEYSFQVNKEKKELEVKTLRYNFQGNPHKKVLTETRICRIAVDKLNAAMFYPGEERSFIINASEIQQELNGKKEVTDTIILDFNESFVGKATAFQKDFNDLVSQLRRL